MNRIESTQYWIRTQTGVEVVDKPSWQSRISQVWAFAQVLAYAMDNESLDSEGVKDLAKRAHSFATVMGSRSYSLTKTITECFLLLIGYRGKYNLTTMINTLSRTKTITTLEEALPESERSFLKEALLKPQLLPGDDMKILQRLLEAGSSPQAIKNVLDFINTPFSITIDENSAGEVEVVMEFTYSKPYFKVFNFFSSHIWYHGAEAYKSRELAKEIREKKLALIILLNETLTK